MEFSNSNSPFDCILFDLDDTLYSSNTGIAQACKKNIEGFLMKICGLSAEEAAELRVELFRSYGSSLAGLLALGYDVHPDDYHGFVHWTLPYEKITPDPQLLETLNSMPQIKMIFTNSDVKHAKRVLEKLGIGEQCFDDIICFETMNSHLFAPNPANRHVILKPSMTAFEIAIRTTGADPHRILFLDDSERNIAAGKALGLRTSLIGQRVKSKEADYLVESVSSLRRVIPEIWGVNNAGDQKEHNQMVMRNDLDSIRAATAAPVEA